MQTLASEVKDTLFIVTADHGQIDIEGEVNFYSDDILNGMLEIHPYMEPRAVAFKVKEGRREEFAKYFTSKYAEDFELHESRELIEKGFFGDVGDKAPLLGDFVAIGTYTHKQAVMVAPIDDFKFKGHHTSLTEEMLVPLIIIAKK